MISQFRLSPILAKFLTALTLLCYAGMAFAQLHPPEVRQVFPIGGSIGFKTRVVIGGVSFRGARKLIFDRPDISALILPENAMSAKNSSDDGVPVIAADISVGKNVPPGVVYFRVASEAGVSNAVKWSVGRELATIEEREPNNSLSQAQSVQLPISINGKIDAPGDIDVYSFDLSAGKTFVAEVDAADVDSPLDSLLTLFDASGKQAATNDDFHGADSLVAYTPAKAGKYFLAIRSSIGSGSGNDSYRLSIGVIPVLIGTFPATVSKGTSESVLPFGFNLTDGLKISSTGEHSPPNAFIRSTGAISSNSVWLGVSDLPKMYEIEPNDDFKHATSLKAPCVAIGTFLRIDGKAGGDLDYYLLHVDKNQRLIFDLQCQDRTGVRCDPILTLYDGKGVVISENDDAVGKDSRIDTIFTASGDYFLRVKNQNDRSGKELVYQLSVQLPSKPGFSLSTETRNRSIPQGGVSAFVVNVKRESWEGPVRIEIADLPRGVKAAKLTIEAGVAKGLLTLETDANAPITEFPIHIRGTATIAGKNVTQELTEGEDSIWKGAQRTAVVTDSFLYSSIAAPNETTPLAMEKDITLKAGGTLKLKVSVKTPASNTKPITLTVLGLPEGVSVAEVRLEAGKNEAELELKAMPTVLPGNATIVVNALVQHNPLVLLDRFSAPITLHVVK